MNKDTIKYVAGICCTLLCNVLMVVGNYIMKGNGCSSADVTLFKGIFQIPIFAVVIVLSMTLLKPSGQNSEKGQGSDKTEGQEKSSTDLNKEITFIPSRNKDKAWTIAYGIFNGARFAAFYAAVLFMPMADYIVCIATTPIFSYVFSCLLIKTRFTILKSLLCVAVILGISLVMQPPFLFGYEDSIAEVSQNISSNLNNVSTVATITDNATLTLNATTNALNEDEKFTSSYWIGVGLAFTFAVTGAMCNVIPVKCKRVSTHTLMFWAGLGNVIFSFLCVPLPKIDLVTLFHPDQLEIIQWIIVIVLGFLAVVINQLLIWANILASPTVNSMTRRSEIILVLFIDMLYFKKYPGAIKGIGYAIVLVSVVGMAAANDLQAWIDRKFKKQSNQEQYNVVTT